MDCWETEIKVLTNYSKTTLGGAISHSANSAPRSLGARKDETIIFGLARSRIQPGFSLLQSTGLFPPQAKSICHPACLQLEKWGLPWWPEHICTAWTWNKPIKDWQLLIGQLWADFRSSLVWRARIISHTVRPAWDHFDFNSPSFVTECVCTAAVSDVQPRFQAEVAEQVLHCPILTKIKQNIYLLQHTRPLYFVLSGN